MCATTCALCMALSRRRLAARVRFQGRLTPSHAHRAKELLMDHCNKDLLLADIARECGLSRQLDFRNSQSGYASFADQIISKFTGITVHFPTAAARAPCVTAVASGGQVDAPSRRSVTRQPGLASSMTRSRPCSLATAATRLSPNPLPGVWRLLSAR